MLFSLSPSSFHISWLFWGNRDKEVQFQLNGWRRSQMKKRSKYFVNLDIYYYYVLSRSEL